jgi:hypothetical protein
MLSSLNESKFDQAAVFANAFNQMNAEQAEAAHKGKLELVREMNEGQMRLQAQADKADCEKRKQADETARLQLVVSVTSDLRKETPSMSVPESFREARKVLGIPEPGN